MALIFCKTGIAINMAKTVPWLSDYQRVDKRRGRSESFNKFRKRRIHKPFIFRFVRLIPFFAVPLSVFIQKRQHFSRKTVKFHLNNLYVYSHRYFNTNGKKSKAIDDFYR